MSSSLEKHSRRTLFAGILLNAALISTVFAQATAAQAAGAVSAPPSIATHASVQVRPRAIQMSQRAIDHYQLLWGVDSFVVRTAESGLMVRFSYRVVDSEKAKAVNDKKATPYLVDEAAHVRLLVPSMEKVGQLRQSGSPEAGKSYWMVFSNKGNVVKPGDRVSVVVGRFRVDGLVVE